jgi:hypothetical protein
MIEVFTAIGALILELLFYIFKASIRPWRFAFSSPYRLQVREGWGKESAQYVFLCYVWGLFLILLSTGSLVLLFWAFLS